MAKEKEQKKQSLSDVLKGITKDFGEGVITMAEEHLGTQGVIPFTIPSMNRITTIGGVPRGRAIELQGLNGSFKSTFSLDLITSEQEIGGKCAFIDAEYSYSPEYAAKLGVDNNELILVHPSSTEEAYSIIEQLVETGEISLIVLDSTTALSPSTEQANEFGASNMGQSARLSGQFFRRITAKLGKTNTTLVLIAQQREVLGCISSDTKISWTI